jgi:hypothetical protein
MENAVTTLAHQENTAAVQKAADHYSKQMVQILGLPTDTLQELLDMHAACKREAIATFMELSFRDENQEFQKRLMVWCLSCFVFPDSCSVGMMLKALLHNPVDHFLFLI